VNKRWERVFHLIKAVLFDLDGTLLDRDQSIKRFIDGQYDRMEKGIGHIPKEKYVARFIELDDRGYVWKDKVYQQLVKQFTITDLTWEELLQDYKAKFKDYCVPFPNLLSMLDSLKGSSLALGVITNGHGQFQMDSIQALGIASYFDVILISEWEGIKKPDPAIFKRALEKLHCHPHECLFIGDHPDNDVKAAKAVGMTGIWKRDPYWSQVKADYILDDLGELLLILSDFENKTNK
jgi:putative hydrolase of the HAD superfamily